MRKDELKEGKENHIVLRTALAHIRYRKSSGILIGISIMLTAALIMLIGSSAYGIILFQRQQVKITYGDFHGTYAQTDAETYARIVNHPGIETAGGSQIIAQVEEEGQTGFLYAMDAAALGMLKPFPLEAGRLPVRKDEIAAPAYFLRQLGYEGVVGEKISLSYRVLGKGEYCQQQFVVSGLVAVPEMGVRAGNFACLVTEEYADGAVARADRIRTVYFKINNEQDYNTATIEQEIRRLTQELGIAEARLTLNSMYLLFLIAPNKEVILTVILLILMVIFFSVLVIYNIYYVGLVGRIHEFGKIRALGAGKRQLKGMVFLEGILIGGIAVPAGIILGGILAQAGFGLIADLAGEMRPSSAAITVKTWHPAIVLLTAVVTFLTIWWSLRKPMKIVARVSPVEAIGHTNSVGGPEHKGRKKGAQRSRKLDERPVSLFRLMTANLRRNRKRTVTTILTLGLSSVLFIAVANVGAAISAEDMSRRIMEKGDFMIALDYQTDDQTYPENNLSAQQERGLLDEAFAEEISAIPGVTGVEIRKGVLVRTTVSLDEDEHIVALTTFNRADWEAYRPDFVAGETDYDALIAQGGIVYTWADKHRAERLAYETGAMIPLVMLSGQGQMPVKLLLSALNESLLSALMMPEESFEKLGLPGNTNYELFIYCEPQAAESVEAALEELIARDEAYELLSYRKEREAAELSLRLIVWPIYGLLIAMGVIGFMNMANTLITGIITRKQELGVLQAIGLTNRQMAGLLQMEGLVFTAGTLLLALTVGNGLGYAAFAWARDNYILEIAHYHFPAAETLVFVIGLLFLQLILSWLCSRAVRKEGIITRLRQPE